MLVVKFYQSCLDNSEISHTSTKCTNDNENVRLSRGTPGLRTVNDPFTTLSAQTRTKVGRRRTETVKRMRRKIWTVVSKVK